MERIGAMAFGSCNKIKKVYFGEGIKTIASGTFGVCETAPDVYYAGSEAEWSGVYIEDGNPMFKSAKMHYGYTK